MYREMEHRKKSTIFLRSISTCNDGNKDYINTYKVTSCKYYGVRRAILHCVLELEGNAGLLKGMLSSMYLLYALSSPAR